MRIDINSPDGNVLTALSIATKALGGRSDADVVSLRKRVLNAKSPTEARRLITETTDGLIEFYNSDDEPARTMEDLNDMLRTDIARVLVIVARDGFPGPRDLDVALDAIFSILETHDELPEVQLQRAVSSGQLD